MPKRAQYMLSKIGVNKNPRTELHNDSNIISKLSSVIEEAGASHYPSSVGELIYEVATTFPDNALVHRPKLLQYITTKKIRTKCQLAAAFTFLSTYDSKVLNRSTFEAACGVGLTDAQKFEIIKLAVDDTCKVNKKKMMVESFEKNLEEVRAYVVKKYPWANQKFFEVYIIEKVENCSNADDKKSDNKEEYNLSRDTCAADDEKTVKNVEKERHKIQVHVKGLDIAKASANQLKSFRRKIRENITTARRAPSAKVFFLPRRKDVREDPFFLLKICTGSLEVIFIYEKSSLYSVGYITSEEKKKVKLFRVKKENIPQCNKKESCSDEDEEDEAEKEDEDITSLIEKIPELKNLNLDFEYIELPVSYRDLEHLADKNRSKIDLGQKHLEDAIHKFCKKNIPIKELAKSMIVVIQMFPEAWRFSDMEKFIHVNYIGGKAPGIWLTDLQTKWNKLSRRLKKWIITKKTFTYDIDGKGSIYNAEKVAAAVLIAKNSKGKWGSGE